MTGTRPTAGELLVLALAGESFLVLLAVGWTRYRGLPLDAGSGPWVSNVVAGLAAAAAFAVVNHWLLCHAPAVRAVRAVRRVYRDILKPVFSEIGVREVVAIALAAGIGEELLFRGALQPEIGLLPASLVFGALHMGGRGTLAFGCWVAVMGAALGWLAAATGGLLAPVVAHAVYDAAALVHIRWGRDCKAVTGPPGEPGGQEPAPQNAAERSAAAQGPGAGGMGRNAERARRSGR